MMKKEDLKIGQKYRSLTNTKCGRKKDEIIKLTKIIGGDCYYDYSGGNIYGSYEKFLTDCEPLYKLEENYEIY